MLKRLAAAGIMSAALGGVLMTASPAMATQNANASVTTDWRDGRHHDKCDWWRDRHYRHDWCRDKHDWRDKCHWWRDKHDWRDKHGWWRDRYGWHDRWDRGWHYGWCKKRRHHKHDHWYHRY